MADKLVSSIGGSGPGEGGIMDIMMPLAMGIASAAHPSLARGASAITNAMSMAGRNKRLKELMDIQSKAENRQEEIFNHAKSNWPVESAKAKYHQIPMGGGSIGVVDMTNPTAPPTQIVPPWEGSKGDLAARKAYNDIQTTGQVRVNSQTIPMHTAATIETQNNAAANQLRNAKEEATFRNALPPSQQQLFVDRNAILNQMKNEIIASHSMAKANREDFTPADEEAMVRNLHKKYGPQIRALENKIPGIQPFTIYDAPPMGYRMSKLTDPKLGPLWSDPDNPQAPYWYPIVPYQGW